MRYPEFLKPGGRIGFIAPSFGCSAEPYASCFDAALRRFSEQGYSCVEGPNTRVEKGLGKSNTPRLCAAEIQDFFCGDRCDVILSCGGGETMCEDLSYVDFQAVANAVPRWYMGYSDNTNLTFVLPTVCDTAAVYGPCAPSFGLRTLHPALTDAFDVLTGRRLTVGNYDGWEIEGNRDEDHPFEPYRVTEPFHIVYGGSCSTARTARFSGRLLGGCLDVLQVLCGTRFDRVKEFNRRYEKEGTIWFLEACELNPLSVRRVLWQLDNAGWFDTAMGFLIGRPGTYGAQVLGLNHYDAVCSALVNHPVPVLMDLDIGHLPPMMPLITGAFAEVESSGDRISVSHRLI